MPIYNAWIIRALIQRLRQPEMKPQRRFITVACAVLFLFLVWAFRHLFRQPTENDLERAALEVFAVICVLIFFLMVGAVIVRKRTSARWTTEEALRMGGQASDGRTLNGKE